MKTGLPSRLLQLATLTTLLSPFGTGSAGEAGYYIAFSQDASQILILDSRRAGQPSIHFLDAASGQEKSTTQLSLDAQRQLIMGFTPDGFKLAVLEAKGLSILHNQTGKTLRTLPVPGLPSPVPRYQPQTAITNASGSQQLFHEPGKHLLQVIHTGSGKNLARIELPKVALQALGMSADGRMLAYLTRGENGKDELVTYDIYQHKATNTLSLPRQSAPALSQPITLSKDGKHAVILPWLLNLVSGESTKLTADTNGTAIFSSDSRHLLYSNRNTLQQVALDSGQQQALDLKLPGHCVAAAAYDLSVDGTKLLLAHDCGASPQNKLSILDAKSLRILKNLPRP